MEENLFCCSYVSQYNSEIFGKLAPFITQANAGIDSVKQNIELLKNHWREFILLKMN